MKPHFFSQAHAPWPAKLTVPEGHEIDVHHPSTGKHTTHTAADGEILLPLHSYVKAMRPIGEAPETAPEPPEMLELPK